MSDHTQEHHDHVPTYVKLAVLLSIVTAIEVAILYLPLSNGLMFFGLYGLAALKFGFVVAMFMHLKYDNKIFTGSFYGGFTIALPTMIAMIALVNYQPTKTSISVKNSVELAKLNAGNPENGPAVFMSKGCAACHKIDGLEGANGAVGPALTGLAQRALDRAPGKAAVDYIRESIDNPNAYVVEGFPAGLMPANLKASMSGDEYKDLVAYLETL